MQKIGRLGSDGKDSERYPGGPGFEPDTQHVFNSGPAYTQGTGHTRERQRKGPGGRTPRPSIFLFQTWLQELEYAIMILCIESNKKMISSDQRETNKTGDSFSANKTSEKSSLNLLFKLEQSKLSRLCIAMQVYLDVASYQMTMGYQGNISSAS